MKLIDGSKLIDNLSLILQCWSVSPYCSKERHGGACDLFREVQREVKEAPTLTPQNEWISVEERLPEDDAPAGRKQITVMVATKAGKVTIASRVFEPERECCGKVYPARWIWSRWLNNYVTHWMPLPAPPDRLPQKGEGDA